MRMNMNIALVIVCMLGGFTLRGAEIPYPFPSNGAKNETVFHESDSVIGISNNQTGVLFSKKDGGLIGIWNSEKKNVLVEKNMGKPLFQITLFHKVPYKSVVKYLPIAAKSATSVEFSQKKSDDACDISMTFKGVGLKFERQLLECDIVASVKLSNTSKSLDWRISVEMKNDLASVWDVDFPILVVRNSEKNDTDIRLVYPYRRGISIVYRPWNLSYPYPGPAVKFQFMSVYGVIDKRGFYYGVRDSKGYKKFFTQRTYPKNKATLLSTRHIPSGRLLGGTGFNMSYSVETTTFKGGWWDAARIYRKWWVGQKWASKGQMLTRKDVPQWLKEAEVSVKVSTSKPSRTIPINMKYARELHALMEGLPILGIWYNYHPLAQKRWSGYGFDVQPRKGAKEALAEFKKMNYHIVAYVQSMIYDQTYKGADKVDAEKFLTEDIIGGTAPYHEKVCGCRFTKAWQERINKMSNTAMDTGFTGIYLDSFGKSSPECFARNHGHSLGGGNTGIAGQRVMASKVRELIKSRDSQSAMAGEAPIEAFVDKLDYYLFAVNSMSDYVPLWRTVFGDYMIGHGRGLAFSKTRDNIIPSLGTLFLEGTIFGRVQLTGKCLLLDKGNEEQKNFFMRLVNYNKNGGLEYLRFGEYLKPLKLSPAPEKMTYQEYVQNNKVTIPYVMNSVTRSHKDGSTAFVFVNVGDKPYKGSFAIPAEILKGKNKTAIFAMSESGEKKKIADPTEKRKIEFEIAPNEVKFFIAK